MNMQENKHCFSTLNSPNTFRFKGVLQNGAEKGLNPAKSLISSCKVILSGWQLWILPHGDATFEGRQSLSGKCFLFVFLDID